MEVLSEAVGYLQEHNDEYDSTPTDIGITNDNHNGVEYLVDGRFPEEGGPKRILPPKKAVSVDPASNLHESIESVFDEIRSGIEISGAGISSIHIAQTYEEENGFNTVGYSDTEADARAFINITGTVAEETHYYFYSLISQLFSGLDNQLTRTNIKTADLLYSDNDTCLLNAIRGTITTPRPHLRYNIESVQEYVEIVSDSPEEYDDLLDQSTYDVQYNINPSPTIQNVAEKRMWAFINSSLETEWEFLVEAEGLMLQSLSEGSYDPSINYYLTIPIVGEEIGVTYS